MRAAGDLLEVRTDDLRFTLDECAAFFNQVMKLDITPAEIQALAARTEGWAVGLQMAAISLQNAPDRALFIQTFSGSHRYILDYLIQEVLDRQPEHVRSFLLKTSILERMCSELCETVVGESVERAANILDYLDRANLFLIPLGQERNWYRYHHLFADLLASQLQRLQPAIVAGLHLQASAWYEMNSQADAAIEHALAARDLERATNLVEREACRLGYLVEHGRMQHWIERLPPEMIPLRPWIAVTQAWLLLVLGKRPALANLMDQIEENYKTLWACEYPETDLQDLLANIKCLRAYMAFFAGDLAQSIALSREALQLIQPGNESLQIRVLIQSGEVHQANRDNRKACEFLHQALDLGISLRDYHCATIALMRLYRSLRPLGKLTQAGDAAQKLIRVLTNAQRMQTPIAGKASLCWGDLLRERGQREPPESGWTRACCNAGRTIYPSISSRPWYIKRNGSTVRASGIRLHSSWKKVFRC
jgi:LuxR family maltose regulon positive regulatory protein